MARATTFRLSEECHLRLRILREVLDLSTSTAALQYAIGKTYDRLPEIAPHALASDHDARAYLRRRLNDDLSEAYRATTYEVFDGPRTIGLRIDEPSDELDALLERHDCESWAFVTAENPLSQPLAPPFNALRTAELAKDLESAGWVTYRGRGVGADWRWAPEDSRLVLGPTEEQARVLGQRYGQAAWLYGRRGAAPCLIWAEDR